MSIEQVAKMSGYSTPHIKKVEGGHSPTVNCLHALLLAYGSNLPEFFESVPRIQTEADREIFEKLQFILDEARGEEAGQVEKDRAEWILGNIHIFYRDAIRPVGRVTRFRRQKSGGGGVEAAKLQIQNKIHGKYKNAVTNTGKFPD
jgi:transcriptional regulator with XRE-family HTH domain